MLIEKTLFGTVNKIEIAIKRLQLFEQNALTLDPKGYAVMVSGGKDSSAILQLAILSGVKFTAVHSHTTVDYPETVRFIRSEKARIENLGFEFTIFYPRMSMWEGIRYHGLPTRKIRWCCDEFKERAATGRYAVTGVRWAESKERKAARGIVEMKAKYKRNRIVIKNDNDASRKVTELCLQTKSYILNPIIDWSDDDIWHFLDNQSVPLNPLYGEGFDRVGCIGCPLAHTRDFGRYPKYENCYYKAAKVNFETRTQVGKRFKDFTFSEYWAWWRDGTIPERWKGATLWGEDEEETR